MRPDIVLEARSVVRDLGEEMRTRVLHDVDLAVARGELVALTGASGSGKSTLLYLLGALDRPTAGEIVIDGISVGPLDDDHRAALRADKLGFVFQFHFLLAEFNVLENVTLPLLRQGVQREAANARACECLEDVGIAELAHRKPRELSGGQQQRVSIARAVAKAPKIILADEPTGSLDSRSAESVISLFEHLVDEQGMTLLMVTHERSFAARAHRNVVMRDGRIVG